MSLAADRIQAILREIDVDPNMTKGKTAQEIADILLNEDIVNPMQSVDGTHPQENTVSNAPICEMHLVDNHLKQVNDRWVVAYYRQFPNHRRKYEKLITFAKKVVRKLLKCVVEPITKDIQEFHEAVTKTLNTMRNNDVVFDAHIRAIESGNIQRDGQIQSLMGSVQGTSEKCMEFDGRLQAVEQGALQRENKIVALMENLREREQVMAKLSEQPIYLNERAMEHQQINAKIQTLVDRVAATEVQCQEIRALKNYLQKLDNLPTSDDEFYHHFEERFRGTREDIKGRLQIYVPIIKEYLPDWKDRRFVDIGSGRGEWLDILRENGATDYIGVDLNTRQNAICESFGHKTVCEDCINYLSKLPNNSVDLISGIQIIEHLCMSDIMELLKQSLRVLKKDGIILFETPNPRNCMVGADTFYIDPSHKRVLDPSMIAFFAEWTGFSSVRTIDANANPLWVGLTLPDEADDNYELVRQFNEMKRQMYGPMDYALFAVK